MTPPKNITGQKFGRLTAIRKEGRTKSRIVTWLCQCDCGRLKVVPGDSLRRGSSKSCGCLQKENGIKQCLARTIHSHSRRGKMTGEYICFNNMHRRCYSPQSGQWNNYGGRGIQVCLRWWDFANFLADMGLKPSPNLTLERIKNDVGYMPSNCKWATRIEQARNRRNRRLFPERDNKGRFYGPKSKLISSVV